MTKLLCNVRVFVFNRENYSPFMHISLTFALINNEKLTLKFDNGDIQIRRAELVAHDVGGEERRVSLPPRKPVRFVFLRMQWNFGRALPASSWVPQSTGRSEYEYLSPGPAGTRRWLSILTCLLLSPPLSLFYALIRARIILKKF